jgi:hypothetical protein
MKRNPENNLSLVIGEMISEAVQERIDGLQSQIAGLTELVRGLLSDPAKDTFLNKKEACSLLKITPPTLRKWEREGRLTPTVRDGKLARYSKLELLKIRNGGAAA